MNNKELVAKYGFKKSLITNNSVQVDCEAKDWKEAIRITFAPLVVAKTIEPSYIDAVIANTIKYGPYYVIAPNLAMPHADARDAVHTTSFSIAVFKNAVNINDDVNAKTQLLVGFASPSKNEHLAIAIPQVVATFENPVITEQVVAAASPAEVLKILDSVDQNKYIDMKD